METVTKWLCPQEIELDVDAANRRDLLRTVSALIERRTSLRAPVVYRALWRRERASSTGVGNGFAIPHARIKGLKKPFGILARLKSAIDFDAIDDKPIDIVFLLLLPVETEGEHITALASVARMLRDAESVGKLRHAADNADIYRAMTENRKSKIT